MNKLKKDGFVIISRTAGSHGVFDIIAISRLENKILLIQSKPKNFSKRKKEILEREYDWLNGLFLVEFVVK